MDENAIIKMCCVMRIALKYLHIVHFDTRSQSGTILFALFPLYILVENTQRSFGWPPSLRLWLLLLLLFINFEICLISTPHASRCGGWYVCQLNECIFPKFHPVVRTTFAYISFVFIYLNWFEWVSQWACVCTRIWSKDNERSTWIRMSLSLLRIFIFISILIYITSHRIKNTLGNFIQWYFGAAVTGNLIVRPRQWQQNTPCNAIPKTDVIRCHNEQTNCYNLTSVQNIFIFKLMTNVFDVEHISMSSRALSRRLKVERTSERASEQVMCVPLLNMQ